MARRANAKRKPWQRMERGVLSPSYFASVYRGGLPEHVARIEVWANDTYEATVEHRVDGWAYVTLKRFDRRAVRDWRHLQSVKNEVLGPEWVAVEVFPPESMLVDEANQYHLWGYPDVSAIPMVIRERAVGDHAFTQGRTRGEHRGRQRPWQPGLSTGPQAVTE